MILPSRGDAAPSFATIAVLATIVTAGIAVAVGVGGLMGAAVVIAVAIGIPALFYLPGAIYAAYLLLAFYKGAVQPYLPVDLTVVIAALCVFQVVPMLLGERRPRPPSSGLVLFAAMSLLILASNLWAPDQSLSIDRTARWWMLVFFPIAIASVRVGSDERYVRQFLWSFFVMGSLVAIAGMANLSSLERVTVFEANTIQVARAALLVPILAVAFVLPGRVGLAKAALIVLVPASLIVAIGSGSRGPLLFFLVVVFIGLGMLAGRLRNVAPRRWLPFAGVILASMIGIAAVATQLPETALDRFTLLGEFIQNGLSGEINPAVGDTSAGNRVVLFELAATMFADHPLIGVGASGFESQAGRYLVPAELEDWPHNSVLQVAAEFGLAGLAIFLSMIGIALFRRLPYGSVGLTLRILLIFFLLNTLVSGDIFSDRETWGLLMLTLVLAPATLRVPSADSETSRSTAMPAAEPRPA